MGGTLPDASALAAFSAFPDEAEEPTVNLVEINQQVLEVAVWGGEDLKGLRRLAEEVRAGLQQVLETCEASLVCCLVQRGEAVLRMTEAEARAESES
mgnify:CR=1 FL=1